MGVWPAAIYFDWVARYVPWRWRGVATDFGEGQSALPADGGLWQSDF